MYFSTWQPEKYCPLIHDAARVSFPARVGRTSIHGALWDPTSWLRASFHSDSSSDSYIIFKPQV